MPEREPSGEGLTIGWGKDLISGMPELCVCYRGRCIWVEHKPEDRDLGAAEFMRRFISPALVALAG